MSFQINVLEPEEFRVCSLLYVTNSTWAIAQKRHNGGFRSCQVDSDFCKKKW